jgi:hypothetical protein
VYRLKCAIEIPAVKAINAGDPPTIESDTHPAKGSWCPRKSPTDLAPHPESSSLDLFIPKFFHLSFFLSSEFIIIGLITHSRMACLAAGGSGLLAQLTPLWRWQESTRRYLQPRGDDRM